MGQLKQRNMLVKLKKRNKYGNKKNTVCGIAFDSERESKRYLFLKQAERDGIIANLKLQPKFELIPKITENYTKQLKTKTKICERTVQLPITYTADFEYVKDGKKIIEDVKISKSLLPKEFSLKIKMLRYFYGIEVRLVFKEDEPV